MTLDTAGRAEAHHRLTHLLDVALIDAFSAAALEAHPGADILRFGAIASGAGLHVHSASIYDADGTKLADDIALDALLDQHPETAAAIARSGTGSGYFDENLNEMLMLAIRPAGESDEASQFVATLDETTRAALAAALAA